MSRELGHLQSPSLKVATIRALPSSLPIASCETAWKAHFARLWNACEKADVADRALAHQRVWSRLKRTARSPCTVRPVLPLSAASPACAWKPPAVSWQH